MASISAANAFDRLGHATHNRLADSAGCGAGHGVMAGRLPATVREVSAAADPATRTFAVKADVGAAKLRLGQTATVRVDAPVVAGVVKLPLPAVFELGGASNVWLLVVANLTVRAQPVAIGGAEGLQGPTVTQQVWPQLAKPRPDRRLWPDRIMGFSNRRKRANHMVGLPAVGQSRACSANPHARVAKLVDAPGLGPDAFTGVSVRVRSRAPAPFLLSRVPRWPSLLKPWKS